MSGGGAWTTSFSGILIKWKGCTINDVSETSEYGTYTIYGLERKMAKGVTVALNMQSWTDAAEGSEAESTLFLNLEYKF